MRKFIGFTMAILLMFLVACTKTEYKIEGPNSVSVLIDETKELTYMITPETAVSKLKVTVEKPELLEANLTDATLKVKGLKVGETKVTLKLGKETFVINAVIEKPAEVVYEETTILNLLQTGKNNDKVMITGVVYGLTNNGIYLEDSDTGKIYATFKEDIEVSQGEKIKVKAEYGLISGYPRLKNVELVERLGEETTYGKPIIETTIEQLLALNKDEKVGTYANVFNIIGTITKSAAGFYQLKDEEGNEIQFTDFSDLSPFEGKENQRYAINVILHEFSLTENKWRVSFVGSEADLVEKPITLEELMPLIQAEIDLIPKELYGHLILPETHETLSFVTYSYDVAENDYLSFNEANEPIFDIAALKLETAVDLDINLHITVTSGQETQIVDYPITIKAIKERTVSNLIDESPEVNLSYVIVSGRVLAFARNQSLSIRSYIIEDPVTKQTTTVDFDKVGDYILNTSDEFSKVKVGDDIVVHGQYYNTTRENISNITQVDVKSSNNLVVHDFENAYVLKDEASYEHFGANYEQFLNKLVKIELPYFTFSTSTVPSQTNWVRIYHNEEPQVYDKDVNKRFFAFLIATQSENLGNDKWTDWFDIPFSAGPAAPSNVSFYAYVLYPSATYLQFVIPSLDEILFGLKDRVEKQLEIQLPASALPGETIDLNTLEDLVPGGITWSVDQPLIDLDTGLVGVVAEITNVTLTATFNDGDTVVTLDYVIQVQPPVTYSVSELLGIAEDGITYSVEGHFIGYFSDGNANGVRGLILKDKLTSDIVFINDSSDLLGSYGNAAVDGVKLIIGDELFIRSIFNVSGAPERREFIVNASTQLEIKSNNNELLFPESDMIVISNQAEMVAFFENPTIGKIIKFVGTEEVPFAFGGSSSDIEKINYKFTYNKEGQSNDDIKYPDINGKLVSFKNLHNRPNAGETWWIDLFDLPENAFVGPNATNPLIQKYGTFYGVYSAQTGTYHQMNFVNADNFDIYIEPKPLSELVEEALIEMLPATVSPGETINLPTSITDLVNDIDWSEDTELINVETGLVGNVTEITNVTLKATFTDGEAVITLEFIISVVPAEIEVLSVTDVITNTTPGDTVKVKGVVAGFYWNGSGALHNDLTHGIILRDPENNNMLYLTGLHSAYGATAGVYTVEDVVIQKGDEIELFADYIISEEVGYVNRKELNITSAEAAQLTILNNNVSLTWNLTDATLIQSNEDLSALASNLEYGKIFKLSGAFGFRASASSYGTGVNFVPGFKFSASTDYNHTVSWADRAQRFSVKFDGNAHNLGSNWWETALNVTAENYGGTSASGHLYNETSEIYFIVGSLNPTAASGFGYIQLSILDSSWINATRIIE